MKSLHISILIIISGFMGGISGTLTTNAPRNLPKKGTCGNFYPIIIRKVRYLNEGNEKIK